MLLWPVISGGGFVLLVVVVIVLGVQSTSRWEQDRLSVQAAAHAGKGLTGRSARDCADDDPATVPLPLPLPLPLSGVRPLRPPAVMV